MSNQITPKEALYGYVAWLTTRRREIRFGSSNACCQAVDTLKEFEAFNPGIGKITGAYPNVFTHPVPTYFSPSSSWFEKEVRVRLVWLRFRRWWLLL